MENQSAKTSPLSGTPHPERADAPIYDQMVSRTKDIPFWIAMAKSAGGPVLEYACGTGRVTIPLAQAGVDVTGLELDPKMLARGKVKAAAAGVDIRWEEGNCLNFSFNRKFPAIFAPFNFINLIRDSESQKMLFDGVRKHLSSQGVFVLDTFHNRPWELPDKPKTFKGRGFPDPDGRGMINLTHHDEYDAASQIRTVRTEFVNSVDGTTHITENTFRIFFPMELLTHIESQGFRVIERFGSYDKKPFTSESNVQLIVCQPK